MLRFIPAHIKDSITFIITQVVVGHRKLLHLCVNNQKNELVQLQIF